MATMRESLMKLAEVAKPVPGDEQDFVAKHVVKTFDFQGKDSISQESPYDLILKNVAVVKKPGDRGIDDHGHDAPGESEAAYHIPESRDAKIAKLSEMMGNKDEEDEEEDDEDDEEDEKKNVKEAKKQVVGVEMHYTHPKKKPFKITHFSVPDAERGKKEYEKMGYKLVGKKAQMGEDVEQIDELKKSTLASYVKGATRDVASASRLQRGYETDAARSEFAPVQRGSELAAKNMRKFAAKRSRGIAKAVDKLAKEEVEQLDEIGDTPKGVERLRNYAASDRSKVKIKDVIAAKRSDDPEKATNRLGMHQQFRKKAQAKVNAADAAKNPKPEQKPKDWRDDVYPRDPKDPHGIKPKYHMDEEMKPLLPGQKEIAKDLLKKEMEARKKQRNDNRQAGTPKLTEEDRREANDKARKERIATPRPTTANTLEGMRHRLQVIKKQVMDDHA